MEQKGQGARIFKTKRFDRFASKESIEDADLCAVVHSIERGIIDADLGGGVIKQRIARRGEGKSGGYRTIIFFRSGSKAFFIYGFAKGKLSNISSNELRAFKTLADEMLDYDDVTLAESLCKGAILEVECDEETVSK